MLVISVLAYCNQKKKFPTITNHMYDTDPQENHLHLLVKAVAESYLQVRFKYDATQMTNKLASNVKVRSRQLFTKLIHFSGQ